LRTEAEWLAVVTTAPREPVTICRTLKALASAGFREILVSAEPGSHHPRQLPGRAIVHWICNERRLHPWPHWLTALRYAIERHPGAQIVMFQDDVLAGRDMLPWLDGMIWRPWLCDSVGVCSLWLTGFHDRADMRPGEWWTLADEEMPRRCYGALATVWTADRAERLLRDPPGPGSLTKIDIWLGRYCRDARLAWIQPGVSLVQHIGDGISSIDPKAKRDAIYRQAARWVKHAPQK